METAGDYCGCFEPKQIANDSPTSAPKDCIHGCRRWHPRSRRRAPKAETGPAQEIVRQAWTWSFGSCFLLTSCVVVEMSGNLRTPTTKKVKSTAQSSQPNTLRRNGSRTARCTAIYKECTTWITICGGGLTTTRVTSGSFVPRSHT